MWYDDNGNGSKKGSMIIGDISLYLQILARLCYGMKVSNHRKMACQISNNLNLRGEKVQFSVCHFK